MTTMLPQGDRYSAAAILKELGIVEPEDIHIEAIAEHCGATILYEPLEGCSARILGNGDRAIITVNSRSRRPTQRFSGGHELGHWMHDRGKTAVACIETSFSSEWRDDNPERRANRFAADLLLPEFIFTRYAKNKDITFESVRELADRFETSITATAIRFVELGSYPAVLVCNGTRGWRWFVRHPAVPGFLRLADTPGEDTVAHELLTGVHADCRPMDVCAAGWIDHRAAFRYVLREDSIRVTDELVLSLLWWKDERQLLDL